MLSASVFFCKCVHILQYRVYYCIVRVINWWTKQIISPDQIKHRRKYCSRADKCFFVFLFLKPDYSSASPVVKAWTSSAYAECRITCIKKNTHIFTWMLIRWERTELQREQEGSEKEITLFIYLSGLISVVTGLLKKSLW